METMQKRKGRWKRLKRNSYFKLMYVYIAVSAFLLVGILCGFNFARSFQPLDWNWKSHYDFEHMRPIVKDPHFGGVMTFTISGMAYSNPLAGGLAVICVLGFMPLIYFLPDEEVKS